MREFASVAILLAGMLGILPPTSDAGQTQASRVDLVAVVGCVVREGTDWFVANATGPLTASSPDGSRQTGQFVSIEMAEQQDAGTLRYRLIGVVEEYDVPEHDGQQVLARGLIIEDDDETRLNVTAVVMVEPTCP